MSAAMQCVGGPYAGCVADVRGDLRHGDKVYVDDWMIGPGTIPAVPTFNEELCDQPIELHEYTVVMFSGSGGTRYFLAYGTDNGMWVLDELRIAAMRPLLKSLAERSKP